jgi:hypothetical protein
MTDPIRQLIDRIKASVPKTPDNAIVEEVDGVVFTRDADTGQTLHVMSKRAWEYFCKETEREP